MADQQPLPSAWEIAIQVKELLEKRGYKALAISSEIANTVQVLNPKNGKVASKSFGPPDDFTNVVEIADELEKQLTG